MNTDDTWRYFGTHDPYFGVLTDERFRRAALTRRVKASFFETGRDYVDRILGVLLDELGLSLEGRVGIDFGCGVGRLTIPLAAACRSVTGVDVSEAMLAEARENCMQFGVDNAHFALSDDSLSTVQGPLGFVPPAAGAMRCDVAEQALVSSNRDDPRALVDAFGVVNKWDGCSHSCARKIHRTS